MRKRFCCVVSQHDVKKVPLHCNRAGSRTFRQKKHSGGGGGDGARTNGSGGVCKMTPETAGTLGSGDLKQAVGLPTGEDLCEWVAVNTVEFFQQINMLYGTLAEFCTDVTCPVMSAGPRFEYYWADGQTVKKPVQCSAPRYINNLMTWTQNQLDNEAIFPSKIGVPFPSDFLKVAKGILKRLFRVYAHIYNVHFREVQLLDESSHLNTSFKHFVYFVLEFGLVRSNELEPLKSVIDVLTAPKADRPSIVPGRPPTLATTNHSQHPPASSCNNTNGVIQTEPTPLPPSRCPLPQSSLHPHLP